LRLLLVGVVALGLAVGGPPAGASAAGTAVWAVGDGADAGTADDAVAAMIASRSPDAFLYLGDVYERGTASEFTLNYGPGYGRLKPITKPTPGNHEWGNRSSGYDPYWGPSYSAPHYYSFDLGSWHLISMNSEEPHGDGSAQLNWLRGDLAARAGTCTIAYWHRPRYSAGSVHGDESSMEPVWQALVGHAAIVLAGHDHDYQRLKPIDGITSWVVGTGGHGHYGVDSSDSRLAAWNASDYGALRLELSSGRADYAFVSAAGAVLDHGSVGCQSGQPGRAVYPRPGSATPLHLPLVPAYAGCTSPNGKHVAPLSYNSCNPPVQESALLTTSAIGRGAAYVKLKALVGDPTTTAADEADATVRVRATDVKRASDGLDYTGDVMLRWNSRITDSAHGASTIDPATTINRNFSLLVPCTATSNPDAGSICQLDSTLDSLVPGLLVESRRTIMGMSIIRILDTGDDGRLITSGAACPPDCGTGDERLFLRQGVFLP
jgi:hypothetical protein